MPLTIAMAAQKGGAGKTTIALHLADALQQAGRRVLVVDSDPQGSARTWADVAADRQVPCPTVIGAGGPSMRATVVAVMETADVVIIDTPPRMAIETKTAMALADVVLVPVSPGPSDIWALGQTQETLDEVRALRPNLKARVVLNRLDRRTALGQGLGDAAAAAGLVVMEATLGNRVAFPEAIGGGQGAVSYAPKSDAANEVTTLLDEVLSVVGGQS
ncbi:MAG: ParA family partition ATPase [Myxococcota bacterium]